jgi:threonine dehydratase
MPLTVYVSKGAPKVKIDAMRAEGADVRLCRDYDEAERRAKAHGGSGDAVFISPYAHPDVIAGAGTVGLEILDEWPEVGMIVVAVGGGGLISGIALVARESAGPVSVVGVEAEASSPFTAALAAGRIVEVDVRPTLADGLAGNLDPDTPTFDIVRSTVDRIVRVSESDLRSAVAGVVGHERLIAEGAGAAGVAAVLAHRLDTKGCKVAVVLSGANIEAQVLRDLIGDGAG